MAASLVGVVASAPPAAAQFDCSGSCGDMDFVDALVPSDDTVFFGERITARGFAVDDSNSCVVNPVGQCNSPTGSIEVYDEGLLLGRSGLKYHDKSSAEWGFAQDLLEQLVNFYLPAASTRTPGNAPGQHDIRIQYVPGGSNYFDSNSHVYEKVTVLPDDSTATIAQSPANTVTGQTTHVTAHVDGVYLGDPYYFHGWPHKPSAAVVYFQGGTIVGTGLLDANGDAAVDVTLDPSGSQYLITHYIGDGDFRQSYSDSVVHTFTKGSSHTVLSQSAASTVTGESFTLTATVSAASPASGTATGTVHLQDATTGQDLGDHLLSNGSTSIAFAPAVGSHTYTANYLGDAVFNPSSTTSALTHVTVKGAVTNALEQSKAATVVGEPFDLTSTIAAASPAVGTPAGSVTFNEGSSSIGSRAVSSGRAVLSIASLGVGSHSIGSTYGGDTNFNGQSSTAATHDVTKAASTVALGSPTPEPVPFGSAATFTASVAVVAPGAATPSGTVQFKDGAADLGAPVPVTGNTATFTGMLSGGAHSVTAVYSGDGNLFGATSPAVVRTVPCTRTITGVNSYAYTAPTTGMTCIVNAEMRSSILVPAGAQLSITNSKVFGSFDVRPSALGVSICGTTVNGGLSIDGVNGPVLIGDPAVGCTAALVYGRATLTGNRQGVRVVRDHFSSMLTVQGTTGGSTVISGNHVGNALNCYNNTPDPVNLGVPNAAGARAGECASPSF